MAATAREPAATALAAAATVRRKRRLFVSVGMLKGGVLCTRSASIMGFQSFVVEVRAVADGSTPSARLDFMLNT